MPTYRVFGSITREADWFVDVPEGDDPSAYGTFAPYSIILGEQEGIEVYDMELVEDEEDGS